MNDKPSSRGASLTRSPYAPEECGVECIFEVCIFIYDQSIISAEFQKRFAETLLNFNSNVASNGCASSKAKQIDAFISCHWFADIDATY